MSASIQASPAPTPTLSGTLPFGLPALFYGVKLWAAVSLALFLAFRLELDTPSWAGTTAALVCQPAVGAALRKGWARMVGTIAGAVAILVITMAFPQDRGLFLFSLALWVAACGVLASLLRSFSTYGGALAGFTAVVIAADVLGPTGGAADTVLQYGLSRVTEILIGIVCATGVLAATDFGRARRQLSQAMGRLSVQAMAGLCRAVRPGLDAAAERLARRQMLRQVSGLSTVVEQAAGEISALPFRPRVLQYAVDGLFATIAAWRVVATHREVHPAAATEADAARVLACLPDRLLRETGQADGQDHGQDDWQVDPVMLRGDCLAGARRLMRLPADTPTQRLLADTVARGLVSAWQTLGGLALLRGARGFFVRPPRVHVTVADYLPSLLDGVRAFLVTAATVWLWIVTTWPSGGVMVVWAVALVLIMAPLNEAGPAAIWSFLMGSMAAAVLAAVVAFAILPSQAGFAGFAIVLGLVLVPVGAMAAQSWRQAMFAAAAGTFVPLVAPSNLEVYDPASFYNNATALVLGVGVSLLALRVMPPISPAYRARRLLALNLRDLRRLTCGPRPVRLGVWQRRAYTRLGAMTDGMELLQHTRMAAGLVAGNALLRLRQLTDRLDAAAPMEAALQALRCGRTDAAIAALQALDEALLAHPGRCEAGRFRQVLRARATIAELTETLRLHAAYFDGNPTA